LIKLDESIDRFIKQLCYHITKEKHIKRLVTNANKNSIITPLLRTTPFHKQMHLHFRIHFFHPPSLVFR